MIGAGGIGLWPRGARRWTPARLASLRSWYDPKRGFTLNTTDVVTWADQGPAAVTLGQYVYASAGTRPTHVAAGGVFGTLPHLVFTPAQNDRLEVATAAAWKFLHDGTGMAVCMRYRATAGAATYYVLDTANATATSHGITILHDAANQRIRVLIGNGGGSWMVDFTTAIGSFTNGASHTLIVTWKDGASPEAAIYIDGVSAGTASGASPSSSNPSYELGIGRRASATNPFDGEIGDIVFLNDVPSAADIASLHTFLSRTS